MNISIILNFRDVPHVFLFCTVADPHIDNVLSLVAKLNVKNERDMVRKLLEMKPPCDFAKSTLQCTGGFLWHIGFRHPKNAREKFVYVESGHVIFGDANENQ